MSGLVSDLLAVPNRQQLIQFVTTHQPGLPAGLEDHLGEAARWVAHRGDDRARAAIEQRIHTIRLVRAAGAREAVEAVGSDELLPLAGYQLVGTVLDFWYAADWRGSFELALSDQWLLTQEADDLLAHLAEGARRRDDARTAGSLDRHRQVLRAWRERGPSAAAADLNRTICFDEPKELPTWQAIAELVALSDPADAAHTVAEYPGILTAAGDSVLYDRLRATVEEGDIKLALLIERRRLELLRYRRTSSSFTEADLAAALAPQDVAVLLRRGPELTAEYEASSDLNTLNDLVLTYLSAFLDETRPRQLMPDLMHDFGRSLVRRHRVTASLTDLDLAIHVYRTLVNADGARRWARYAVAAVNLAGALVRRQEATHDLSNVDEIVELFEENLPGDLEQVAAGAATGLGLALVSRYQQRGDERDLHRVLELCTQLLAVPGIDRSDRHVVLAHRVMVLLVRYERGGSDEGLAAAAQELIAAFAECPLDNADRRNFGGQLGSRLISVCLHRSSHLALLDCAIELLQLAADPAGLGPAPVGLLVDLSTALGMRYDISGELQDLDVATDAAQRAASQVDEDDPAAVVPLAGLGSVLRHKYQRSHDVTDLNRAVDALEAAVRAAGESPSTLMPTITNLGTALLDRYDATAAPADLDRGIQLLERAYAATAPNSPQRLVRATGLSAALRTRYVKRSSDADLDRAVEVLDEALTGAHPDDRALAPARSMHALALRKRFQRDGYERDLERACALARQAVLGTSPAAADFERTVFNFLVVHQITVQQSGRTTADLDREFQLVVGWLIRQGRAGEDMAAALDAALRDWGLGHFAADTGPAAAAEPSAPPAAVSVPVVLLPLLRRADEARRRFLRTQDDAALVEAAEVWRTIVGHPALTATSPATRRALLGNATRVLRTQVTANSSLTDVDAWLSAEQALLACLDDNDSQRLPVLVEIARGQATRSRWTNDPSDLDRSFSTLTRAIREAAPGSPPWCNCLRLLVHVLDEYRPYAELGPTYTAYAAHVRMVDSLVAALPPEIDGIKWLKARTTLAFAHTILGQEPGRRLESLRRSLALTDAAATLAAEAGESSLAAKLADWSQRTRTMLATQEGQLQLVEVDLGSLLTGEGPGIEWAGDRLDSLRAAVRQASRDDYPVWHELRVALLDELTRRSDLAATAKFEEIRALLGELLEATLERDERSAAAMLCTGLSDAYLERTSGDRLGNVETALRYAQQAVDLSAPGSCEWVQGHLQLAFVLGKRIVGSRQDNTERAVECCREAAGRVDPADDPRLWAAVQYGTGTAYLERVAGMRADNIDEAIARYTAALDTVDGLPAGRDEMWANAHHMLGIAYAKRLRGGREDNLRRAINHYRAELTVFRRDTHPRDWALAHHSLGNAYAQSRADDPVGSQRAAVEAFESALTVLTRDEYPLEWANVQENLSITLIDGDGIGGGRTRDPARAMDCLTGALSVYTSQTAPYDWARVQGSLAGVCAIRADREADPSRRTAQLHACVGHVKKAATVLRRDTHPIDWAEMQLTMAQALVLLGRAGDASASTAAVRALEGALDAFQGHNMLRGIRLVTGYLIDLYSDLGWWESAAKTLDKVNDVADTLYQASLARESRNIELSQNRAVLLAGAAALVRCGRAEQAIVTLERGRARWLGETLARDRADLVRLLAEHPTLAARYSAAAERIRLVETEERSPAHRVDRVGGYPTGEPSPEDPLVQFEAVRGELDAAILAIRRQPGYEEFLQLPDIRQIAAVATPGRPMVYLQPCERSCLILVAHRPRPAVLEVDARWVEELPAERLREILLDGDPGQSYLERQLHGGAALKECIESVLARIGELLSQPLADMLHRVGADAAILVPGGLLALVPVHALPHSGPGTARCLLDDWAISYAPSAWVLANTPARQVQPVLAGVGNPTADLPYAGVELEEIAKLFPSSSRGDVHLGEKGTKDALMRSVAGASYVHLSCHGYYDLVDPMRSHLRLSGDARLTLRELLDSQAFRDTRLVVASACQTAITEFLQLPDEAIGLPGAFLHAGATAVIGTLWPVDDLSTALLMIRFYQYHLHGGPPGNRTSPMAPAEALRRAQSWLAAATAAELAATGAIRSGLDAPHHTPFAHPYYWAPFVLVGV